MVIRRSSDGHQMVISAPASSILRRRAAPRSAAARKLLLLLLLLLLWWWWWWWRYVVVATAGAEVVAVLSWCYVVLLLCYCCCSDLPRRERHFDFEVLVAARADPLVISDKNSPRLLDAPQRAAEQPRTHVNLAESRQRRVSAARRGAPPVPHLQLLISY